MKAILDISRLSEKTCEKICKNIAFALKDANFTFYETADWLEIYHDMYCIANVRNANCNDSKYKHLLQDAVDSLYADAMQKHKPFAFNVEAVLIDFDLHVDKLIA